MQSRRDSHQAPPRRPVSLKIGPQIKSNQILRGALPDPPANTLPTPSRPPKVFSPSCVSIFEESAPSIGTAHRGQKMNLLKVALLHWPRKPLILNCKTQISHEREKPQSPSTRVVSHSKEYCKNCKGIPALRPTSRPALSCPIAVAVCLDVPNREWENWLDVVPW